MFAYIRRISGVTSCSSYARVRVIALPMHDWTFAGVTQLQESRKKRPHNANEAWLNLPLVTPPKARNNSFGGKKLQEVHINATIRTGPGSGSRNGAAGFSFHRCLSLESGDPPGFPVGIC